MKNDEKLTGAVIDYIEGHYLKSWIWKEWRRRCTIPNTISPRIHTDGRPDHP